MANRNPNELSVASLIHTISTDHIRSHTEGISTPTFQLMSTDRETTLEAKLFNLRARRATFTPVMRTRAQHAREPSPLATIEEVDELTAERDPSPEPEEPIQPSWIIVPVPDVIITPPSVKEPDVVIPCLDGQTRRCRASSLLFLSCGFSLLSY